MEGYIKAFRSLLKWEWYCEPNTMRLFVHCLLNANYQESKWQGEVIPAGSFVTSSIKLASELALSRDQIRYAIDNLKHTNEITTISTNKYTVINVANWAKYQSDVYENPQQNPQPFPTPIPNKSPTNPQQIPTDKELKKERIKEIKNKEDSTSTFVSCDTAFYRPTLDEVKSYCKERGNNVDPETWFNFYDSKGWLVGKTPMKKWKAAIRTWESKDKNEGITRPIDKIGKPKIGTVL